MNNPYKILNLNQNATKSEIHKALLIAMKDLKNSGYTLEILQLASKQLLDPAKRLSADFMYPTKIKAKRPHFISLDIKIEEDDYKCIDVNAFNSI